MCAIRITVHRNIILYTLMHARTGPYTHAVKCANHSCSNSFIIRGELHSRRRVWEHERSKNLSSPSLPLPMKQSHLAQQGGKSLLPSEMEMIHMLLCSWTRWRSSDRKPSAFSVCCSRLVISVIFSAMRHEIPLLNYLTVHWEY